MIDPFSIKPFSFPKGFLFGSATAGHQIEGNNINSNNYYWEQELKKKNPEYETSGLACNSYEMYEEDNKILASLGHKMYRMSIEWSRIEPNEGEFCIDQVEHYIKVFESLKQKGIKLCLSLTHGTMPLWFALKQHYNEYENIKYFERYIEYVAPKVAKYVDYWLIFNEHNGGFQPEKAEYKFNSVRFHARAYHIIKKYSKAPISTAHMLVQQFPKRMHDKFDLVMQNYADLCVNEFFFHAIRTGELVLPFADGIIDKDIKGCCDFWAINSYRRKIIDSRNKDLKSLAYSHELIRLLEEDCTFSDSCFNGECMIHNLTRLIDKPVLITENGLATDDDDFRIIQLVEYLCAISQAIDIGVDVIGYLHWSLLDNYEWGSYIPKFGLVSVDRENGFKRTVKRSALFYKDVIENNGFNQEILKKYLTKTPTSKWQVKSSQPKVTNVNNGEVFQGGVE